MKNPKELHEEFVKLGRERYRLMNRLLLILPEIYESGIWRKYANDIYEYAGRFGGLSKSAVEKRLKLEKHLEDKPKLREAIEKVGINKVALVATLATAESEAVFADKALNMSKSALVTLSKELRGKKAVAEKSQAGEEMSDESESGKMADPFRTSPCRAKPQTITIELDEEMTFLFLKLKKKFKKLSNREMMRKILEEADERTHQGSFAKRADSVKPLVATDDRAGSATNAAVPGDRGENSITGDDRRAASPKGERSVLFLFPEPPGGASAGSGDKQTPEPRTIKAKRKKETLGNGRCSYPGCNKPAEHIHHPQRYGKTKNHDKLVALCRDHHEFMHNGLIENEAETSQEWTMSLYKMPDAIDQLYRKRRADALT